MDEVEGDEEMSGAAGFLGATPVAAAEEEVAPTMMEA